MPFDHNDHYHRLLLRKVPPKCEAALDVGCGTGRFAHRLAHLGTTVVAIDPSEEVIAEARARSGRTTGNNSPRFEQGDVTETELPAGHYDFISCLASIHHVTFDAVAALREALAPGGVLVILGCYPEKSPLDWAWSLAAVPANATARLAIATVDKFRRPAAVSTGQERVHAPWKQPTMSLSRIRREAEVLLPGCSIRRLLFWRYLLVFRNSG
ncbi:MAG TPA: class I SAM-dependent methyltransferase [Streptomyces sp.]|jgi:2-polyprenyl-3-methyl-5-hydroxy-6-metoxy-1,4-benzoquinol methylase|nr:class I SAM-dependent methyltransferase [Streptomyces sp.]